MVGLGHSVVTLFFLFPFLLRSSSRSTGGPKGGIPPASHEPKQERRGLDCGAGLDAKPGGGSRGDGGDCRRCRRFSRHVLV